MTKTSVDRLELMPDGALRKAIQSLENAHGSVEYAIRMMPEGLGSDVENCNGPARDASDRIEQQLEWLRIELDDRQE